MVGWSSGASSASVLRGSSYRYVALGMLRSGWPRTLCFIALVGTLFVLRNAECATAPEPGDLRGVGKVTFPITCAPDVQSDFARGVALLHSFFYEEARRVFTSMA